MKKKLVLLLFFFYFKNYACDICGSFMGLTPYDNQSQICLLHRYRIFNGYRNYQESSNFFIPGAYKIAHNDSALLNHAYSQTHSVKDYESYKAIELRAKYFITPKCEVNFIVPVQQIKTSYNTIKTENTGIADPSLFAGYHLMKRLNDYKVRQRLIIGAGIKFPLGDCNREFYNQRANLLNQNGTGSWDSFYYMNYILSRNRFGINSNTLFKLNGKNKYNERIANSFNQIVSLFIRFEIKNIKLFTSAVANYEYTKGLYFNNIVSPNTKMNTLLLGPGIDLCYKNLVFNTSFQFNAYERVSSQSLSTAGRFVVALTYNFEKKD